MFFSYRLLRKIKLCNVGKDDKSCNCPTHGKVKAIHQEINFEVISHVNITNQTNTAAGTQG